MEKKRNNDLIKVGKYNLQYNKLLNTDIKELDIFRSKGLPAHMIKRKHFTSLKYIDYLPEILDNPDYVGIQGLDDRLQSQNVPLALLVIHSFKSKGMNIMKLKTLYTPQHYNYAERIGNLKAEAVGVVKGEKHFPIFENKIIFKPLTKSKPLSTPLFAYAEVFWSRVINEYFMPAPQYRLAFCTGYEAENTKYYDYGTSCPIIYEESEHLMNLLEFFRKYPDDKVQINDYINYCQMFYDYTQILESDYFKGHPKLSEELAMQILVSVLKGDQNYHYENIAFICNADGHIKRLAPMIDHEFSTYFMFPDSISRHLYCFEELKRSIKGRPVQPNEYACLTNETERKLMGNSAICLHKNLV